MKKEYIYAGITVFFWSTTATVTKLLLGNLNSIQVMIVSSLVAFLFLLFLCIKSGDITKLKNYTVKDVLIISGIGIIGTFFNHLFLYLGIDSMQASQAFIINYLWPIMTVVFACIILGEKMTVRKGAAIILSFIGVIIVTSAGNSGTAGQESIKGAFYCVMAAVSYGLFSALNKKTNYDKKISMMIAYFAAFLISLIWQQVSGGLFELSLSETAGLFYMGIFTNAVPYTLWAMALDMGDTAKISNTAYITPFLSLLWTSLILKEKLSIYTVIGLIVIISGIFIQMTRNEKQQ